ncbi:hypothetical protein BJX96DRAFT_170732 [Aspergillus floccosus]
MKIMFLNPVGDTVYNKPFADMARRYKDPNTQVTVASLHPSAGPMAAKAYGATGTLVAAQIIHAVYQARKENYDAFVINCFGEYAFDESRQIGGDMLVIGPAQSSIETALRLSRRYTMILNDETQRQHNEQALRDYGTKYRPVSYRSMGIGYDEDPAEVEAKLVEQGKLAVERDGAEVLLLACTLALGWHEKLQDVLGVPVVDPAVAALKTAELSIRMKRSCGWGTSNMGSLKSPTETELQGFQMLQEPYIFGGRIEIE